MAGEEVQTFSFDTVAVLVAMLMKQGGSVGMAQYERMSSLDGKRTASSFDHQFRKVKNRAKEINAKYEGGDAPSPVTPSGKAKASKANMPATGEKKRVRKTPAKGKKDEEEIDGGSPTKKVKAEPEYDEEVSG